MCRVCSRTLKLRILNYKMTPRRGCSAFGCLNTSLSKPLISFFTLPADTERRMQWLRLIDREDLVDVVAFNHYQVCEIHFNTKDIMVKTKRKMLKKNAIPSLNLPNYHAQVKAETSDAAGNQDTETSDLFSANTPWKRKLTSNISRSEKLMKNEEEDDTSEKLFHKLCDRFLTRDLAELVKSQTYLKHSSGGNGYKLSYKMFCLNLYYASPQAYRLLEKVVFLPSRTTLNKMYIPISTHINDELMRALKVKVDNMSEAEKNCSIVVDAIGLKANLFYSKKHDKIIGFQDVDGVQSPWLAKHALVVIVRGINVNWMQPIGYALLAEFKSSYDVSLWIDNILIKLFEIGLKVRVFVSGLGYDLLNVANERSVSIDAPYFYINDKRVYYIFDPPHLIKLIRNNLMSYNFHFRDDFIAKYDHIVDFYEQDKTKTYKLAYKLSNSHIDPSNMEKTKVQYATQLLSKSVACGISTYIDFNMIDESGRGTVQFVQLMNDLFDTLNSSRIFHSYEYKKAFRGDNSQVEFLNKMVNLFETLKLVNPKNGNDFTKNVKFIQGFIITIKSVMFLFEDLKLEGFEYILTRRLNLDVTERFFGKIRSKKSKNGMATEPTSWQFASAFRKLYFANILKTPHKGNCADDLSKLLVQLNDFNNSNDDNSQIDQVSNELDVQNEVFGEIIKADYSQMEIPEKNSLSHVCGSLLRKCAEKHNNCEALKTYMDVNRTPQNLSEESRYLWYRDYAKDNTSDSLVVPPDDFVNYIERMDNIFQSEFEKKHIGSQIGRSIYEQIQNIEFISPPPCPCFPKAYLQKLFVRMRLYFTLKLNNSAFRTSQNSGNNFSVSNFE